MESLQAGEHLTCKIMYVPKPFFFLLTEVIKNTFLEVEVVSFFFSQDRVFLHSMNLKRSY